MPTDKIGELAAELIIFRAEYPNAFEDLKRICLNSNAIKPINSIIKLDEYGFVDAKGNPTKSVREAMKRLLESKE